MSEYINQSLGTSPLQQKEKSIEGLRRSEVENKGYQECKAAILASLLPDEVIYHVAETQMRDYYAILLLGDVSGFTYMCDQYDKSGTSGSSQITIILNHYLGKMIRLIVEKKGDILNFSGDAFLAMWKFSEGSRVHKVLENVVDVGLEIQRKFGRYKTAVNELMMKIGIAIGECRITMLVDVSRRDFVISGHCVDNIKLILNNYCSSGDLVLCPVTASRLKISGFKYKFEDMKDGYLKVVDHKNSFMSDQLPKMSDTLKPNAVVDSIQSYYELRPSLEHAVHLSQEMEEQLKLFMMDSVVRVLESRPSIDYLSEMRQLVIIFINVVVGSVSKDLLSNCVRSCFLTVASQLKLADGEFNKVSMFDKDLMFLGMFGLRRFVNERTIQAALKCGVAVRKSLLSVPYVMEASVAVTKGRVYCGIVGHPIRREFTVMGLTVNKAARLMVAYPGKVTCDDTVFIQSCMSSFYFVKEEPKTLKGIDKINVYSFHMDYHGPEQRPQQDHKFPILGRDKELKSFRKLYQAFTKFNKEGSQSQTIPKVVAVTGNMREGKTLLLQEMILVTENHSGVWLDLTYQSTSYYQVIQTLFNLTCFANASSHFDKQKVILNLLSSNEYQKGYLSLLNPVFNLHFPFSQDLTTLSEYQRKQHLRGLFKALVAACFDAPFLLVIDNAELMDDNSWELLRMMVELKNIMLLVSIGVRKDPSRIAQQFIKSDFVLYMKLNPISSKYHIGLICQMLEVVAVPQQLLTKVEEMSEGHPGWVETYLQCSLQSGTIAVERVDLSTTLSSDLIISPMSMLVRGDRKNQAYWTTMMVSEWGGSPRINVCRIKTNLMVALRSSDELVLMILDRLPHYLQTILKCCAIIGAPVQRKKLIILLYSVPDETIAAGIAELFLMRILECAYSRTNRRVSLSEVQSCRCPSPAVQLMGLPKYAFCTLMTFRLHNFEKCTLSLLTDTERQLYQFRLMLYIENDMRRCDACNNVKFAHIASFNILTVNDYNELVEYSQNETFDLFYQKTLLCPSNYVLKGSDNEAFAAFNKRAKVSIIESIGLSNFSLTSCQCHLILHEHYTEVIRRCRQAKLTEKLITSVLEYIPILIGVNHLGMSLQLMQEARTMLKDHQSLLVDDNGWKAQTAEGVLDMLLALCNHKMGLLSEALQHYNRAMNRFNYPMPKSQFKINLMTRSALLQIKAAILYKPKWLGKVKQPEKVVIMSHAAECLYFMSQLHRSLDNIQLAKLCGLWSLSMALQTASNFFTLLAAISNMFSLADVYREPGLYESLKGFAIQVCVAKISQVDVTERRSILNLYLALMSYNAWCGDLDEAIDIATKSLAIAESTQRFDSTLIVLPRLFMYQMLTLNLESGIEVLGRMERIRDQDVDQSITVWFYSLALVSSLMTGMELVSVLEVEQFDRENYNLTTIRDPESKNVFYAAIWLHYIRLENWDQSRYRTPPCLETSNYDELEPFELLLVLEGLLIYYSKCRLVNMSTVLAAEITKVKSVLHKKVHIHQLYKPRYFHLLAYEDQTNELSQRALKKLLTAQKLAAKQNNQFEQAHISVSASTWWPQKNLPKQLSFSFPSYKLQWHGRPLRELRLYPLPVERRFGRL